MNRLCDMEPRVMDDEMLKLAVGQQGPRDEAGQLAKQEGILFKDVLSLQLDFQNILRIDSLWQFENLRKLQLDNNVIEKIEGLENLTRLVWLDLSFNNIEAIEGLDTLVNLEDLSLFNNRISKIDSLDALAKLQVLSLGNNQIGNMMNIIYLRRFKDLRTLSLSGNPVAEAEDYRTCICAYLPDLVYLDFRRIDDQTKELAEMKHQYSVDELKHRESLTQARLEDERARRQELAEHEAAFVEHLNGPFLFDSMYAEDMEGSQLSHLPGVGELLQTYKDKFVIICLNIFEYGLKQQEKRKAELDTFMGCVQEAVQEKQEQGKHKIAKFEEKHLLSLSSIRDESELTNFEIKMAEYSEDITELANVLMTLEMQLVEQLEETINMFERNIIDLVGLFVENVQSLYPFLDAPLRGGAAGRGALRARTTAPRLQGAGGSRLHFKQKAQKGTASSQLSRMQLSGVPSRWLPVRSHACPLPLPPRKTAHLQRMEICQPPGMFEEYFRTLSTKAPYESRSLDARWAAPQGRVLARLRSSEGLHRETTPRSHPPPVLQVHTPWGWGDLCAEATDKYIIYKECRDLENHHHGKLLEIAISTLEKIVKGELDEDLPDAVRSLFVDKDTIVNAVGASHDIHLLKIDNREDELVTKVNSWCAHLVDKAGCRLPRRFTGTRS
ncbi:dynein regulatory complex subunit 3 isoform 4-T8 [Megaptera novaeangliae]